MYNRSRGSGGRKNEIMEEAWQGPLGLGVGVRREAFGGYKAGTGLQAEEGEKGEGEKGETRSEAAAANGPKKGERSEREEEKWWEKKKRKKEKKCEGRGF